MSLRDWLKADKVATVTPATLATHPAQAIAILSDDEPTVAAVATVSVADPVAPASKSPGHDLAPCSECRRYGSTGYCLAAAAGELKGVQARYSPAADVPRRCECFVRARTLH